MNRAHQIAAPISLWQILILFLSIYVLGALFIDTIFVLPSETSALLTLIDNIICFIFIGDFLFNAIFSRNRLAYLKWGWIDLITSIPNLQILRWGRLIRVIRIIRILRAVRSVRVILGFLFAHRVRGTMLSVAMVSFLLVIFSAIVVLNCETDSTSNIKTAPDALWWSFSTITTVGYGDKFPVTTTGRIIAAILMTAGVGLFGTFTAYVASFFLQQEEQEDIKRGGVILKRLAELSHRIENLEKTISQSAPAEGTPEEKAS